MMIKQVFGEDKDIRDLIRNAGEEAKQEENPKYQKLLEQA